MSNQSPEQTLWNSVFFKQLFNKLLAKLISIIRVHKITSTHHFLKKKNHVQLRRLYGEQYQTFNADDKLHLLLCVENLGSSSYGHLLVSVTKIIVEIYKIYFMEHSILCFTLLLEITSLLSFIVSYKRS